MVAVKCEVRSNLLADHELRDATIQFQRRGFNDEEKRDSSADERPLLEFHAKTPLLQLLIQVPLSPVLVQYATKNTRNMSPLFLPLQFSSPLLAYPCFLVISLRLVLLVFLLLFAESAERMLHLLFSSFFPSYG